MNGCMNCIEAGNSTIENKNTFEKKNTPAKQINDNSKRKNRFNCCVLNLFIHLIYKKLFILYIL